MDELATPGTSGNSSSLLILEQSSHLDWDWLLTFHQYYTTGGAGAKGCAVKRIYDAAISYVQQQPGYPYVFCEMGYLRQYLNDHPAQADVIRRNPDSFSISSGGITSADNLLCHGEAFIRNYLVGRQWAIRTLGIAPSNQLWIPDDFGQDAQLPIVLQAMGFRGVAFERIPAQAQAPQSTIGCVKALDTAPSEYLTTQIGPDFVWKAADGSSVFAHWLANGYCTGTNSWPDIAEMIAQSPQPSPFPYLFVPIDCDFSCPESDLLSETFQQYDGVTALAGTFDQFMNLVQHRNRTNSLPVLPDPTHGHPKFVPNPYYSGAYISHPDLKRMHYAATRALLCGEVFELIFEHLAFANPGQWSAVAAETRARLALYWDDLVPSTHHDYITGTAVDAVYASEQQPRLAAVLENACALRREILTRVAGAVTPSTTASGTPVAVFNPLSFRRSGLVKMAPPPGATAWASGSAGGGVFPVQYTHDGALLFMAEAPSLGYSTVYLHGTGAQPGEPPPPGPLDLTENADGTITLANAYLSARIAPQGISSLKDLHTTPPTELLQPGRLGNQLTVYVDEGNIYRLGNEIYCPKCRQFSRDSTLAFEPDELGIRVLEHGPVRKTLRVSGTLASKRFVMDYSLVVGEPFLRLTTTGTSPDPAGNTGHAVMVSFPLAEVPTQLTNGTPYHWDTNLSRQFFELEPPSTTELMNFEATHQFVLPEVGQGTEGRPLAAVYHASTPAWGISAEHGDVLGCILRNTPGDGNAACGSDYGQHTAEYAIRVRAGLQSPTAGSGDGGPLGEALGFNNPLIGMLVTGACPTLRDSLSVASVGAPALITAAKAGTVDPGCMILRVYQPTNAPLPVEITLDTDMTSPYRKGGMLTAMVSTALETPLPDQLQGTTVGSNIQFNAEFALTTLQIGGVRAHITNP